jgi:hypothetical protein
LPRELIPEGSIKEIKNKAAKRRTKTKHKKEKKKSLTNRKKELLSKRSRLKLIDKENTRITPQRENISRLNLKVDM